MEESIAKQRASIRRQTVALGLAAAEHDAEPRAAAMEGGCAPVEKIELASLIEEAASREGVSPNLVREVARQESGFRPCAVSAKGAQGLMQLMPATQQQFGVHDPFDARESLGAASKLLRQLLERYNGDLTLTLGAYNAGPSRVDRIQAIPETRHYVTDILNRLDSR